MKLSEKQEVSKNDIIIEESNNNKTLIIENNKINSNKVDDKALVGV